MTKSKKLIAVIAATALFLFLAVITWSNKKTAFLKPFSSPKEKITLGIIAKPVMGASLYIALEKGFFSAEGLEVDIKEYPSGPLALKDLLDRRLEIITISELAMSLNAFDNPDLAIIATMSTTYENMKILARRDKGIKTAADLKGKKLGFTFGTSNHFYLDSFLSNNQINNTEVTKLHLLPAALLLALKDGRVDAIAVWEPYAYEAQRLLGDKIIHLQAPGMFRNTHNLAARRSWLRQNPRLAEKVLRAIDKTFIFIKAHQTEVQQITARRLGMDVPTLAALWDDITLELSIDRYLVLVMEAEARWAIKNNMTGKKKVPNYLDYLYTEGLDAVKPGAVTIIR